MGYELREHGTTNYGARQAVVIDVERSRIVNAPRTILSLRDVTDEDLKS